MGGLLYAFMAKRQGLLEDVQVRDEARRDQQKTRYDQGVTGWSDGFVSMFLIGLLIGTRVIQKLQSFHGKLSQVLLAFPIAPLYTPDR